MFDLINIVEEDSDLQIFANANRRASETNMLHLTEKLARVNKTMASRDKNKEVSAKKGSNWNIKSKILGNSEVHINSSIDDKMERANRVLSLSHSHPDTVSHKNRHVMNSVLHTEPTELSTLDAKFDRAEKVLSKSAEISSAHHTARGGIKSSVLGVPENTTEPHKISSDMESKLHRAEKVVESSTDKAAARSKGARAHLTSDIISGKSENSTDVDEHWKKANRVIPKGKKDHEKEHAKPSERAKIMKKAIGK